MPTKEQQECLKSIQRWWAGNQMYAVLEGPGGVGKSYLVKAILKTLPNVEPVLLAPTHEALKQLKEKVSGDFVYKTVHAALGLTPTITEKELKFEHKTLPPLWDQINLAVIDEASMLDTNMLELLQSTGTRILYVGHRSQLPPIKIHKSIFDTCVSPVFTLGYPTFTLAQPIRNKGTLWEFTCKAEDFIYNRKLVLPNIFDVKKAELGVYLTSRTGKEELFNGTTKVILWSNQGVDTYNTQIRNALFISASRAKYLPGDRIILTKPLTIIVGLEVCNESTLMKLSKVKEKVCLFSNSKAIVIYCTAVIIPLNKELQIPCYRILVNCEGEHYAFYELLHKEDYERIGLYYEHVAWGHKTKEAREKAYKNRAFILSCFAEIKYFYAATAHRLQGSTIETVIVINSDIQRNPNPIEQAKCFYVAVSRAAKRLMIYRGI